jgi:hypothetical protein
MYIIDKTYFNVIINAPNIYEVNSDELNNLNKNIDKYARLFMQNFLGAELFLDFDSHLTGGVLDSNAPQKWKDLVNGATYTKDNKTYVWKGIKYTEGTINESLLAYFVYYYSYQNSINSSVGQVVVNPRNAENINPSEHLTNVWNIFIRNYQGSTSTNCLQFYNNFDFFENNNTYVSLMQFVIDKKENYVNINGPMLNYKNRFGL